jgi:hypothetical protein
VARDASGNFSAGTITAALSGNATTSSSTSGNAATATALQTARTINGTSFNGTANITITAAANGGTAANITGQANSATITASTAATANQIVLRDGSGDTNVRYGFGSYFNSTDDVRASGMTAVMGKFSDNYYRSGTAAAVATFISGQTMNINGSSTSCSGNAATASNASNTNSISNAVGGSYTWTAANYFQSNLGSTSGSLSSPPLQVYATGGNSAFFSFHRASAFAINMGLDSDNVLRIGGWSASANRFQMDTSGNLTMAGNVTAYSDERLKKDWEPVAEDFVERLAKVKHGTYTRIDSEERQMGVSAQAMQKFAPEVVSEDNEGNLSLAYGNAALVAAVKLAERVVALEARLAALEAKG